VTARESGARGATLAAEGNAAAELGKPRRARAHLGNRGEIVLAQEAIDGYQSARVAVIQHVLQLARARPRADGHERGAEPCHREIDDEPLRAVRHEERDLVAAA